MPKINLPEPKQLICDAGDVVIANYLTAHTIACNIGADIRYAIYFRITSLAHQRQLSLCDDPWYDWQGLK